MIHSHLLHHHLLETNHWHLDQTVWHPRNYIQLNVWEKSKARSWTAGQTNACIQHQVHCARCGLDIIIVSTTAPERAILAIPSQGVAIRTGQSGVCEATEPCIFLASIWLGFAGHVVLFWSWLSPPRAQEMDSIGRQWNTEKDARNIRDFSVKRLPSGGTRTCMPQQTWHSGVCAVWEQKLRMFRSTAHRGRPRHWQRGSSLVRNPWLARFVSVWKAPPGEVKARWD